MSSDEAVVYDMLGPFSPVGTLIVNYKSFGSNSPSLDGRNLK